MSKTAAGLAALVVGRTALDLARWLTDPERYWSWEEAYNTGVAWYLGHAGLWDQALTLQYKAFCGGCTVVAAVGAPLLLVGGDHAVAWKAVALGWTAATMLVGFAALDRLAGRRSAWAWALLLALPPLGASDLALTLWGNHQESGLLVLLGLALAARGWVGLAGLAAGLAVWFCRTSLYGVPVVLLMALGRPRQWRVVVGAALGAAPMLLPAADGDWGSYSMSPTANLFPLGLAAGLERVKLLVEPEALAIRLFGAPLTTAATIWLGAMGLAALTLLSRRGWWAVAMAALFLSMFAAAGFPIPQMRPGGAVDAARYHAPWFLLGALVVAASVGGSGWRRWAGGAALILMLSANLTGWSHLPFAPGRAGLAAPAVSHAQLAWIATGRLTGDRLAAASSSDPSTESWLRRMEGYQAAEGVLAGRLDVPSAVGALGDDAAVAGLGQALTDPRDGWAAASRTLGPVPTAHRAAFGRGMASNLAFGVTGGGPPPPGARRVKGDPLSPAGISARLDDLDRLLGVPAPRSALGAAAMEACRRGDDVAGCLAAVLDDAEVAWGAGRSCPLAWQPRSACLALGEGLDGSVGAAFEAGVVDPSAGMDRPFLVRSAAELTGG